MTPDRNKTTITHSVTQTARAWLDEKGFKPVEEEVYVADKWVADIAGVSYPNQTELINLKLIKRPPPWTYDADDIVRAKEEATYKSWKEIYEAIPSPLTALIEVKTSVGDFRGDRKWTAEWPTNLCYVAMPEGMIEQAEWPLDWGIILTTQDGEHVRRAYPSKIRSSCLEQQFKIVSSLAIACDHRTRHARLRELQKSFRAGKAESRTMERISTVINFVEAIAKGQEVEDARRYYLSYDKLPDYLIKRLEELKGRAK